MDKMSGRDGGRSFVARATEVHGDKYDYSMVDYKRSTIEVAIYCRQCKTTFMMKPFQHINRKRGCKTCTVRPPWFGKKQTKEIFVVAARHMHGDKYDYSTSQYINNMTKLEVYCKTCDKMFWIAPNTHISAGVGCGTCGHRRGGDVQRSSHEAFIAKARAVHGDKYSYDLVKYTSCLSKVEIYCTICKQTFWQSPHHHTSNRAGCPTCNHSKGESAIAKYLTEHKIPFSVEKDYPDHLGRRAFDFHVQLPDGELLIEFDGRQHFEQMPHFHRTIELFDTLRENDRLKTLFAIEQEIPLLRLDYSTLKNLPAYLDAALAEPARLILSSTTLYSDLIACVQEHYPDIEIVALHQDQDEGKED